MEKLIPQLKRQDRMAQKALFETCSPKMLSVCRSYINDLHYAEDCMLKAFVKIFKNIGSYQAHGSFEGWIRRIMVNECLDFLRIHKSLVFLEESKFQLVDEDFDEDLSEIDAQSLLDQLSENYRTVFVLFVLEDYSHKEIAELLKISEMASRTQLARAKSKLKELVLQQKNVSHEK